MPSALFVYGTLMPGHLRWGMLAPHAVGQRLASVPGVLHDTGRGWPAATFGPAGADGEGGEIPGWVVEVDPATAGTLLTQLDEIEGLAPEGATDPAVLAGRYRRVLVRAADGSEAWAYAAAWVDPAWRPIERWTGQAER